MRFFTPELLARFGSQEEKVAFTAQEELEKRSEEYTAHLHEIKAKLPVRFLEMLQSFYLHDARVLSSLFPMLPDFPFRMYWMEPLGLPCREGGRWPSLFLALQLDPPPREVLVLNYRAVVIEEMSRHLPFQEEGLPFLEWQYDEVDVVTENGMNYARHAILFSDGFELRLQFSDFDFSTMKPLSIPPETNGHAHRK